MRAAYVYRWLCLHTTTPYTCSCHVHAQVLMGDDYTKLEQQGEPTPLWSCDPWDLIEQAQPDLVGGGQRASVVRSAACRLQPP